MKKPYQLPAVQVLEMRQKDVITTSTGQAGVQNYNWNYCDEE